MELRSRGGQCLRKGTVRTWDGTRVFEGHPEGQGGGGEATKVSQSQQEQGT